LVDRWNSVVALDDTVYFLGDFAFGNKNNIPAIRTQLNGHIVLIYGNHDVDSKGRVRKQIKAAGFDAIYKDLYVDVDGRSLLLAHIPRLDFVSTPECQYHICGHVHSSWTRIGAIINCGVSVCDYTPMTLAQLIAQPEVVGNSHRGY
jgi:calcineurin-like phosphoesterase family protein